MNSRLPVAGHVLGIIAHLEREEGCGLIGRHAGALGAHCPVAPVIAHYLDELYVEAEEALKRTLARVTVDAMSRDVMARVRHCRVASTVASASSSRRRIT